MDWTSLVTTYGPLGLGWPLCWYFVRQNQALQQKILEAFLADTAAKIELMHTVEELADRVGGR